MDTLDTDACYRAISARDARFDGTFFTGVKTTGIFCRPVCPARTPLRKNCTFWPSAAAAQAAGFRPCLRCRPELAPGVAAARGTANTVARALRLIDEGALDEADVERLGERLGVSGRHLRRLFDEQLGASPVEVARSRRALFAKRLLVDTRLPIAEIAFASGFGSIRRFNDEMQRTFRRAPRELRKELTKAGDDVRGVALSLSYRPPLDWAAMIAFLGPRAIPGVEAVDVAGYRRTVRLGSADGVVTVRPSPTHHALIATITTAATSSLDAVVARLRALFDLDAEPSSIAARLAEDVSLGALVARRPGLRVPGAWDGFELGVRAILGQQVSVAAATTFAGRIASRHGRALAAPHAGLAVTFPDAGSLAAANLDGLGLTQGRVRALRSFATWWAQQGELPATLDEIVAQLSALDGIGPWTAHYVAMRAGREPDAFPATDLGLLRAFEALAPERKLDEAAEAWRPWRAYAAMHLWSSLGDRETKGDDDDRPDVERARGAVRPARVRERGRAARVAGVRPR